MRIGKIAGLFKDWVRGGYSFGAGFSDMVTQKLDISPKNSLNIGRVFDPVAGAGITFYAVTSALAVTAGAVAAVGAVTVAPVAAAVTLATGAVYLALDVVLGGIGLGLLEAGRVKLGLPTPKPAVDKAVEVISLPVKAVTNIFRAGAQKLSAPFHKASAPKPAPKPVRKRVPKVSDSFDL